MLQAMKMHHTQCGLLLASSLCTPAAIAQLAAPADGSRPQRHSPHQSAYREVLDVVQLPDGPGGAWAPHELVRIWRPVCGTPAGAIDATDLQFGALLHDQILRDQGFERVSSQGLFAPRGGLDVVFNVNFAGAPPGAAAAFLKAEQYLESLTNNSFTLTIDVTFAALPSQTLGLTSTIFLTNISYTNSRSGLFSSRDADDFIPFYLPSVSVPTRFNATTATVTNVTQMDWPVSLYNATIAPFSNAAGTMQLSSTSTWDVDPTNGVTPGAYSLVDVIIHETGHAMGFVTKADASEDGKLFPLDLFRFASVDRAGLGNTNPATLQEFTSLAREVDYDAPSGGGVESNIIASDIDMSDGDPYQASHLKQESSNPTLALGIMQPLLGQGVTFAPTYFRDADKILLDAMGWNITGTPMLAARRQNTHDWNRDGWPDITWDSRTTQPPGQFVTTHYAGPTFLSWAARPLAAPGWRRVAASGDLNGDGVPDVVWRLGTTQFHAVWLLNPEGQVISWYYLPSLSDARWEIGGIGDMDGDGFDDLVWRLPISGAMAIWYMNSLGYRGWNPVQVGFGPNWTLAGVADFGGNDDLDFLWRDTTTGANRVWIMNNNAFQSEVVLPGADPVWKIKGVGDWNGDQLNDILWWNTTSGSTAWWFMNGTTYQSWQAGAFIDPAIWE
jgi:hypothetical protein